jgi:uncharacterized Zn finger protein (UPF0148 family)
MSDNCPFCGTYLLETTFGRKFCPNHGIIEEEQDIVYDEKSRRYIG